MDIKDDIIDVQRALKHTIEADQFRRILRALTDSCRERDEAVSLLNDVRRGIEAASKIIGRQT